MEPPPHSNSSFLHQLSFKKPLPQPLPPIPIPGYDGIMSDDPMAIVFNLDPRLQGKQPTSPVSLPSRKNMMNRIQETKFFDSLRAKLGKFDEDISFFSSLRSNKKPQKKAKDDRIPLVVRRRTGSLVPGIGPIANSDVSTPLPPPLPPFKNEDKLPKHSNLFTGVPTPTDTAVNSRNHSSANSEDAGSRPQSPNTTQRAKGRYSVPGLLRLEASLKEYCYIEKKEEKNDLPKMPSAKEPQPFTNPGRTALEVEALESVAGAPKIRGKESFLGADGPEVGGPGSHQHQPWKTYVSRRNFQQKRQHLLGQSPLNTLQESNQNRQARTQGLIEEVPGQDQIFIPSVSQRLHSWKPEGEAKTMQERLRTSTSTSPLLRYMRPAVDGALAPSQRYAPPRPRSTTVSSDEFPRFSEQEQKPLHLLQDSELFLDPIRGPSTPLTSVKSVGPSELKHISNTALSAPWDIKTHTLPYAHPNIPRRNALSPSSDAGTPTGSPIGHKEFARLTRGFNAQMPPTPPPSSYSPSVGRSVDGDRLDGGRDDVSEDERTEGKVQLQAPGMVTMGFVPFLHQVREVMLSRDESLFLMKVWYILLMTWAMWALAKLLGTGIELMQVVVLEPGRILCYALKRWLGG